MKSFDMVAVGLAVAAAVSYLVIHFVRAATRKSARAGCPGCAGAASGPVHQSGQGGRPHGAHRDRKRGTDCPGCG